MARIVFLHGHGGWKPQDGYTKVPKGCSISFYTHFAKLLNQTMVVKIMDGTFNGELDRTVGQFGSVPDLVMSNLPQAQLTSQENRFFAGIGQPTPNGDQPVLCTLPAAPPTHRCSLATLMNHVRENMTGEIEFRWLCCQSLGLKQVGGRALGLNASDRTAMNGHQGEYLFKWLDGGQVQTKWVKSNSSIHH